MKDINLLKALKDKGVQIEEGQEAVLNEISKEVNEGLKNQGTTFTEELNKAIKGIEASLGATEKDDDGNIIPLVTRLKEIAEQVDKISTSRTQNITAKGKYQLRKIVKENHAQIVDAIKNRKELKFEFNAVLKLPAMHMTNNGTVTNAEGLDFPVNPNFVVDDEIATIRLPENFILNAIPNRLVSKVPQSRIKTEQETTEGAVTVVAEGAVKPLLQYLFVQTVTTRQKYAGRIEWTEEFEMDYEMLFAEILRMFERDVIRAWQAGILASIIADATAYVASPLDGTFIAPDNGLAIVAAQSQLASLNFIADTVVMNPADVVATMFQQDLDGNLKNSPYINTTTGTINGMRLFSSNLIDQGDALVGDSSTYLELHSDFILRTGQYNAQFIENEYTAIGEVFSLLSIAEIDKPGWIYMDLATVKEDLQQVEGS